MKSLQYQQDAIKELVDKTITLLRLNGNRKQLVFKAPTGAGKTVMTQEMLARLTEELQQRGDLPVREVAYIWIAPNKLHQQSYLKMREYFSGTRLLRAVMYDELDHTLYYYNENVDRQIVKINPNTFEVSEFSVGIKKFK